jgi:hypothetical protein
MDNNGISTFVWRTGSEELDKDKSYINSPYPYYYPINVIPRFQYRRANDVVNANPNNADPITSFKLIRCFDKVEVELIDTMTAQHGLYTREYVGYDLIINPSFTELVFDQNYQAKEGMHYCLMSDGTNTWRSEFFVWKFNLDRFIKVSYWHDEAFELPNSHVRYAPPYKNVIYLDAELGKPDYPANEKVKQRGGYYFPEYQESSKEFRFTIPATEYMLDGMSRIWQHRFIKIESKGRVHYPTRLTMSSPRWEDQGDIAGVDFAFQTDTVSLVVGTGKVATEADFNVDDYNEDFLIQ